MKRSLSPLAIALSAIFIAYPLAAQESGKIAGPAWYLGVNPIAAVVPLAGYGNIVVQMVSGQEIGLAVSGGAYVAKNSALEARLSYAYLDGLESFSTAGLSWKIFPFTADAKAADAKTSGGFFFGPDLRFGQNYYDDSGVGYLNIVPSLDAGWLFAIGPFYVNARLCQSIAAFTFSSAPHVAPGATWLLTPMPAYSPVLPVLSFDLGYRF